MKPLIYIASPYSHPTNRHNNFLEVSKLAAKLCSEGKIAFSPITYGHTLLDFHEMPSDWHFWRDFCLTFLKNADELIVYKMSGWNESRGVLEEIDFALLHNIKISYIELNEML